MKKDTEVSIGVGRRSDGSPRGLIKVQPANHIYPGAVQISYIDSETGDQVFADLPRAKVEELAKKLKEK